jgi:hypothetical protein
MTKTIAAKTVLRPSAILLHAITFAVTLAAALLTTLMPAPSALAGTPLGKTQQLTAPGQVPDGVAKSDWTNIRAAYEAGRHAFHPVKGGWQARNPSQQWTMEFDGRGFVSEPKGGGGWQWGLELKGYGFPGAMHTISGVPAVKAEGQRLTYNWDSVVQEWWVNDMRGLEHGFTVRERPAARRETAPPLQFQLSVRGSLAAQIAADGLGVQFCDAAGNTVINYSGLKVWDADGKILPSHFKPLNSRNPSLVTLSVDERGARYPLTIDPIAQQAYLKPAAVGTTQASDEFGYSVAVSGDTVVVGAVGEGSSTTGVNSTPDESANLAGAAYVFVRNGTTWTQQAYLKPAAVGTTQELDQFGISVAISGDTVVVGASFEDSGSTGVNSTPDDTGDFNFNSGAAYVFVRSGTTWTQQAYLKPAAVGTTQEFDQFGISVAVSGDTVVVGAPGEGSSTLGVNSTPNESASSAGAAYVFVRNAGVWTQQAYLKPAAVGTTQAGDQFGSSVAISGDTVIVGANLESSNSTGVNSTPNENTVASGAAYIFVRNAGVWTQQAYLKPAAVGTSQGGDYFGSSVAVSGDTAVVGAYWEDSNTTGVNSTPNDTGGLNFNSGAAYVFVRSAGVWTQQAYLKPAAVGTTQAGDLFGSSVAVSGDIVVVGAELEDSSALGVNSTPDEGAAGAGAVYVFVRNGTTWTQQAYLKPAAVGTTQALDRFGNSVAVSGDTVVVGANFEDSSTTGVNSTPGEGASRSGAAYVFTGLGPVVAPALTLTRSGTDVIVSWPSPSTGFTLEQTAALAAAASWVTNSGSVSDNGTTKAVTVPTTNSAQFFRLHRP